MPKRLREDQNKSAIPVDPSLDKQKWMVVLAFHLRLHELATLVFGYVEWHEILYLDMGDVYQTIDVNMHALSDMRVHARSPEMGVGFPAWSHFYLSNYLSIGSHFVIIEQDDYWHVDLYAVRSWHIVAVQYPRCNVCWLHKTKFDWHMACLFHPCFDDMLFMVTSFGTAEFLIHVIHVPTGHSLFKASQQGAKDISRIHRAQFGKSHRLTFNSNILDVP